MTRGPFLSCAGATVVAALSGLGGVADAAEASGACPTLASMKIDDTNLLSSALVLPVSDLPEYCRVLGYVRPAINFEIRLPTRDWNGKFYMAGCGGACGKIPSDTDPDYASTNSSGNAMNHGLVRNYAVATTDSGHWGRSMGDRRWAYQNPVARFDYEERAVTQTARVSKEIIKAYYGVPTKRSYFAGCSNGGRQGHMEASKYADDFDGIISGAPALRFNQLDLLWAWEVKVNIGPDDKNAVDFAKVPMIASAVYTACADEGGLIADPRACHFDVKSLQCQAAVGPECLAPKEVAVVEKWYSGPTTSKGEQLAPGFARGTEPYWTDWPNGANEETWRKYRTGIGQMFRCYSFLQDPGPSYTVDQLDFDKDPALMVVGVNRDANGTDLSKFKAHGGKILIWHGLADEEIPAEGTRDWYDNLTKAMGGPASTTDFARLFLAPGLSHCGDAEATSPGVNMTGPHSGFDPLPALEAWVEAGVQPETILMTKRDKDGKTEWARPVCSYPRVARYKGSGAWQDAANWACEGT